MKPIKVDLNLIEKYNVPGPRYTSYPPANHFEDQISPARLLEKVRQANQTKRELSLYFHLPFCHSLCWFCGCTKIITKQQRQSEVYLDYLRREMAIGRQWLHPHSRIVQIHLGGGTPTFLLPEEIRWLGEQIRSQFQVAEDAEMGVEMDPRRLTKDHLVALREAGFNRASLGVQDHNPEVQAAVNRWQPKEMTDRAVHWIRETGFQSLNIDLIYGLPHQTVASFEKTLGEILELQPERLVLFSYAHVPWIKPAQKRLAKILPTPEVKLQILKLSIEKLTSEGYVYIGMDHFAREDDDLAVAQRQKTLQRNFQGYSTWGGVDICAFGMSAISQAASVYWQNQKELKRYYAELDQHKLPLARGWLLSRDDELRRQTIMRLMCDLSLDYDALSRQFDLDFRHYFDQELKSLEQLEADDLINTSDSGLVVTDAGRLLVRNIAMQFDAYLKRGKTEGHSKTI